MNEREKHILNTYFKVVDYDPIQFSPTTNKNIKLSPMSVEIVINLVIKILEEETK